MKEDLVPELLLRQGPRHEIGPEVGVVEVVAEEHGSLGGQDRSVRGREVAAERDRVSLAKEPRVEQDGVFAQPASASSCPSSLALRRGRAQRGLAPATLLATLVLGHCQQAHRGRVDNVTHRVLSKPPPLRARDSTAHQQRRDRAPVPQTPLPVRPDGFL